MQQNSRSGKGLYIKLLFTGALLYLISFLPILIPSKGVYYSRGDYEAQIRYFWMHIHEMYRTGLPEWDHTSALGMSTVGSYSFYNLASPYTLLSLILPQSLLPVGITVINCLKHGVAALGAGLYVNRYVKKEQNVFICGILYAFCGIQLFNVVFQFADVLSIFPFVLYSLDELVYKKRTGLWAFTLALTAVTNYYLFWGECVFLVIYFLVKVIPKEYRVNKYDILRLAAEAACGVLMSAVILLPSFLALLGNSRASSSVFEKNLISYETSGTLLRVIQSMFLLPDICGTGSVFNDFDLNAASISLYIPVFSMSGVFYIIRKSPKRWEAVLMYVCGIFAAVPLLNSIFSAFNSNYYARWFFMPTLVMIMMTGKFLDESEEADIKKELIICTVSVSVWGLLGLHAFLTYNTFQRPIAETFYLFSTVLALLQLALIWLLRYRPGGSSLISVKKLRSIVCVICALPLLVQTVQTQSEKGWRYADIRARQENYGNAIKLEGDEFFRTCTSYDDAYNTTLLWGYPSVNMFHSLVQGNVTDLYSLCGILRESNYDTQKDCFAINCLLSAKYQLIFRKPLKGGIEPENEHLFTSKHLYGFDEYEVNGSYVIIKNRNYIPMGFTFDYHINENDMLSISKSTGSWGDPLETGARVIDENDIDRLSALMLKGIVLNDEQAEKYKDILPELPEEARTDASNERADIDCAERRASACYEFTPNKNGFTSRIDLEKDNLVFYSVPHDNGFTAYVDGKETPIEEVFGGMCAVYVPEGDHSIEFVYKDKGLRTGAAISIASAVLFAIYVFVSRKIQNRRKSQ